MTSIGLIVWPIVTWAMFRMLAGRATLPTGDFFRIFLLGAFGSTIVAIIVERIAFSWLDIETITRLAAAPIDELAKALPVVIVVTTFASRRTLTISDFTLVGLAGGLGYEVVNWCLAIASDVDPRIWHRYLFGSLTQDALDVYFVGAVSAALVGLAAGIGLRLTRRPSSAIAFALLAVLVATFDNGMFRWQTGGLLSIFNPRPRAVSDVFTAIYTVLLHGRLELWLLVGGSLLANWLEGRWARVSAPADEDRHLLDDDARMALVPVEWLVSAARLSQGWTAFNRINGYFRDRRAYALISAETRRSPNDETLKATATALERKLASFRTALSRSQSQAAPLNINTIIRAVVTWLSAHPIELTAAAIFAACFMIPPNASPLLKTVLFNDWLVVLAIVGAGALLVVRRSRFHLREEQASEETMFGGELDARLTLVALGATLVAIGAYFIPTETLIAHYGASRMAPLEAFELWAAGSSGYPLYGGNPHTFFAVAALILSCAASLSRLRIGHAASARGASTGLTPIGDAKGA